MITINLTNEQLPELARLIAQSPGLAQLVAEQLRDKPDTYTVAEAAKAFRVCTKTIDNHIKAKIIPTVPGIGAKRIPAIYVQETLDQGGLKRRS